jgi:hypothetical protein
MIRTIRSCPRHLWMVRQIITIDVYFFCSIFISKVFAITTNAINAQHLTYLVNMATPPLYKIMPKHDELSGYICEKISEDSCGGQWMQWP